MPGKRMPLAVLEANGKKHLTKQEKRERAEGEVHGDAPKQVRAPSWLPEDLRKEFSELSKTLIALDIFLKIDRDTLAMYLMNRASWKDAYDTAAELMGGGHTDSALKWTNIAASYFKAARQCAGELGLTVTSRCRLVVPKKPEEEKDPMEDLFKPLMSG